MRYRGLDDLPDVLTIHEAAEFMRVSPGVAYEMARRYRATNGREGLPVFMAGAADDAGLQDRARQVRRRDAQRWRPPARLSGIGSRSAKPRRGCGVRVGPVAWSVLEAVAEHCEPDGDRTVSY